MILLRLPLHLALSLCSTSCFLLQHVIPYLPKHIDLPPANYQHLEPNSHKELGRIYLLLVTLKLHIRQQIKEKLRLNLQICLANKHLLQLGYICQQFFLNLWLLKSFQSFWVLHFKIQEQFLLMLLKPELNLFSLSFTLQLDFQHLMDQFQSYEQGWGLLPSLPMKELTMSLWCTNSFQAW